jgi:hypothetical protein
MSAPVRRFRRLPYLDVSSSRYGTLGCCSRLPRGRTGCSSYHAQRSTSNISSTSVNGVLDPHGERSILVATADAIPNLTGLDKAAQLDALRARMAAIPGRRDHAPTELPISAAPPTSSAPAGAPTQVVASAPTPGVTTITAGAEALTPSTRVRTLRTLPVPLPMAELLPNGALARGTVLSITGAGSVLVGLVASVSAAGHHVAVIGQPRFGLLAVDEHGGDLTKVAFSGVSHPVARCCATMPRRAFRSGSLGMCRL